MRVLHIIYTPAASAGGITSALRNILLTERLVGIENEVLCLTSAEDTPKPFDPVPVHSFQPSFPARFSYSRDARTWLLSHVRSYNYVTVHTIWNALSMQTIQIAAEKGVPCLLYPHGSLGQKDILAKKRRIKQVLGPLRVRNLLNKCQAVVCTTQSESDLIVAYGAQIDKRICPLPVPITDNRGDGTRFRKQWGIDGQDFALLYLGRLDQGKGIDLLIQAVAALQKDFQHLRLVVVGPDWRGYRATLEQMVKDHHVNERVLFCGLLDHIAKWDAFAAGDLYVLPSQSENFGVAVVEALSAGLPALISDCVPIWQQVSDGCGGWVCRYSLSSLIDTLRTILTHRNDLEARRQNAVTISAAFRPETLAPMYKTLYC